MPRLARAQQVEVGAVEDTNGQAGRRQKACEVMGDYLCDVRDQDGHQAVRSEASGLLHIMKDQCKVWPLCFGIAFDAEKACACAAALDFVRGGGARMVNGEFQIQADARQRVVAIQDDVLGVDVGDDVERILRHGAAAARGHGVAVKNHAFFQLVRKAVARLDKHQGFVVIAKGLFRLQMQLHGIARLMLQQGADDAGQKVFAAQKKFQRVLQGIKHIALHVFQHPGQCNDAVGSDAAGKSRGG
jgi:hypothetical protein